MAQGNYDHPSYLTRQTLVMDTTTAGASGTSGVLAMPYNVRLRKAVAVVRTAGTSAGAGNAAQILYVGTSVQGFTGTALTTTTTTATLGSISLGTSAAGVTGTSTDMDALCINGGQLFIKNGTDATGVAKVTIEYYIDPSAVWTGPPGN